MERHGNQFVLSDSEALATGGVMVVSSEDLDGFEAHVDGLLEAAGNVELELLAPGIAPEDRCLPVLAVRYKKTVLNSLRHQIEQARINGLPDSSAPTQ
jgi:hypothetical protein